VIPLPLCECKFSSGVVGARELIFEVFIGSMVRSSVALAGSRTVAISHISHTTV
jgi:hypothetical protein